MSMKAVRDSALPNSIKSSLDACWKEGVVTQAMIGIFDYFLIPYGLFLGASKQEIGFMIAIPNLLISISQFFAVRVVYWAGSRQKLLVKGMALQTLMLFLMAVLTFTPVPHKIWLLIFFISVFRVTGGIIGPSWGSLVSDYLPQANI
jgi:MFS family permease